MSDPALLLNWQIPFDDNKVILLDNVVNAMYAGNNKDVSILILTSKFSLFLFNLN